MRPAGKRTTAQGARRRRGTVEIPTTFRGDTLRPAGRIRDAARRVRNQEFQGDVTTSHGDVVLHRRSVP